MESQKPTLDIDSLAFANETTRKKAVAQYEKELTAHILWKLQKTFVIAIVIVAIVVIVTGMFFYKKGFKDNQPIAEDGSPIVYITPKGSRYHLRNCRTINNIIPISETQAKKYGYTPCSQCDP